MILYTELYTEVRVLLKGGLGMSFGTDESYSCFSFKLLTINWMLRKGVETNYVLNYEENRRTAKRKMMVKEHSMREEGALHNYLYVSGGGCGNTP